MQPTPSGSGGSCGGGGSGGGEVNRVGLSRFRSAPPTWLETLLEEEEESLKPNQTLTQLLESNTRNSLPYMVSGTLVEPVTNETANLFEPAGTAFPRQNSSPADFLLSSGIGNEGYFSSSYGLNASNYEYNMSPEVSTSSGKRVRDNNFHLHQSSSTNKYPSLVKVEQNSQVPSSSGGGGISSLIEMEMEKILEDSVPCRVRAKRGCATHPRSIAERVRRTRISDRIRKLQKLVPNMDKQTNTADMLDEAVEYVKFLQQQIQELNEQQRKCTCLAKE